MKRPLKITLYKDPWIFCDTERYLEKIAVDCRGIRAELLCGYWAIGLCIVYTHATFDNLCATW